MKTAKQKQIAAELQRIAKAHQGILQPAIVVKEAANPKSPLHDYFEWADDEAAFQYRLWQARQLIRVVVNVVGPTDAPPQPVWVSLEEDRLKDGGGYRMTVDVLSDPALRQQLLVQARKEMEQFAKKYRDLQELAEVFSAMRKVKRAA
jgi:hypothetical protein